jgi:hypothetical protein
MRKFLFVVVASIPTLAFANESPLVFPDMKLEGPILSLAESAQQAVPSLVNNFQPIVRITSTSRMPIIVPPTDCDPKMIVKPDSTIDYKLIVKTPDIEMAR